MKKCLSLPLIALALFTMFICLGCGAKETPPVTIETPVVQESTENLTAPDKAEHEPTEEPESSEETAEHEPAEEPESSEET
ncbi:hypothetical protein J5I95_11485, partial [Candidatus Poribacteria bacterium]|nr:hypothetical protein [Candidatus Poribacteria bacterium]